MSKRKRDSDVMLYVPDNDGFTAINYQGQIYAWHAPKNIREMSLSDDTRYMISVIQEKNGTTMLDILDLKMNKEIVYQAINPWHERYDGNWMLDK